MFKLDNVTKVYGNGVRALNKVTVELPNRGFVAILGKSGSGKSTLLNILSGMDNYTEGTLRYNDTLILPKDNAKSVNNDFAFIHQDYKLIENISVADNIAISRELNGGMVSDDDIVRALKQVELDPEVALQKVKHLSGGQKQRVAIARALIKDSRVIFADEPTGNLDSENSELIFDLLKHISKERLVVLVTHDAESAHQYSDRVIKLVDGRVADIIDAKGVDHSDVTELSNAVVNTRKGSLSFKRTCKLGGWSLANKPIRLVVSTVLVILLSVFCCFSMSMTFLTAPQVLVNSFPKGDNRYIAVSAELNGSINQVQNIPILKQKFNRKLAIEVSGGGVVFDDLLRDQDYPKELKSLYYNHELRNAIVTDDLNTIGSTIIAGSMPIQANELLLSKTAADRLVLQKHYGRISSVDSNGIELEERARLEINSYQDIFDNHMFANYDNYNGTYKLTPDRVVGVFDDRNELSDVFRKSYSYGSDNTLVSKKLKYEYVKLCDNKLLNAVIRPPSYLSAQEGLNYINYSTYVGYSTTVWSTELSNRVLLDNGKGNSNPRANIFRGTTDVYDLIGSESRPNITEGKVAYSTQYSNNNPYSVGDKIKIEYQEYYTDNAYEHITYRMPMELEIVEIVNVGREGLVMSDVDYDKIIDRGFSYSEEIYFNSEGLNIKSVGKTLEKLLNPDNVTESRNYAYVAAGTSDMFGLYRNFSSVTDYIMFPMLLISIVMMIAIMYTVITVNIDNKRGDWMILRAEGAKYKSILGVIAFQHMWLILAQIILGLAVSGLVCMTLNIGMLPAAIGVSGRFFAINASEAFITIAVILAVRATLLCLSTAKLFRKKVSFAINKNK